jgi:hypothetical protein
MNAKRELHVTSVLSPFPRDPRFLHFLNSAFGGSFIFVTRVATTRSTVYRSAIIFGKGLCEVTYQSSDRNRKLL